MSRLRPYRPFSSQLTHSKIHHMQDELPRSPLPLQYLPGIVGGRRRPHDRETRGRQHGVVGRVRLSGAMSAGYDGSG